MRENVTSKAGVKKYALKLSRLKRAGKFTRVSESFCQEVEENTRIYIDRRVMSQPSVGKTIK